MTKFLFLLISIVGTINAQITYSVTKNTSLAAAAEVITIQQNASPTKFIHGLTATVNCNVACTFTLERNGTVASSTTLTVNNINSNETAATATAWSASNVGVGTVLGNYNLAANSTMVIDLSRIRMIKDSASDNFTLRSNSITGSTFITITFEENTL